MECVTVNLIIEPVLDSQISSNHTIFNENISTTVTISPFVLIKDISNVLLHKIGLGHLANSSEAFIKCPQINCFTSVYCFTNPMIYIGNIETWNNEYLTVKICVKGYDLKEGILYINEESNPFVKEVIDRISDNSILSLHHQNLYCLNDILEKELYMITRNDQQMYHHNQPTNDEYDIENTTSTPSRESILEGNIETEMLSSKSTQSLTTSGPHIEYRNILDPNQLSAEEIFYENSPNKEEVKPLSVQNTFSGNISTKRPRIKFNPETETPILESVFERTKIPTAIQLRNIADRLNDISNRPEEIKVTFQNVRNWFSYRRAKEKSNGNSYIQKKKCSFSVM
uniref:Homeobox domain-containing protein n=1 Tax=Strongyloides stercoralis TaxID=6248 RepID=A0AAF5CVA5_STRER